MRRADRLFQIIQILRRSGSPVTAAALAAELETSKRSVYRDVAALIGQRVPVRGEAGLGYVLEGGFDLPPLMLTSDEVEAAVLGAQWVAGHGDAALARAARDLIAKIAATVPENLRPLILDPAARTPPAWKIPPDGIDVAQARAWMRAGRKIALCYRDGEDRATERVVWPIVIGYLDAARTLVGWCELRRDFRNFRTDRISHATFLEERFPARPAALRAKWLASMTKPPVREEFARKSEKEALMAPVKVDPKKVRTFKDAAGFHQWLARHHDKQDEVWIKIHKVDSGLKSITPSEAIDVVLCWGWIDGIRKGLDERSYLQRYSPRGRKSVWSQINVGKVARLIQEGRMTAHGLKHVEAAKADGRWDRAYSTGQQFPADLQAAIDAEPKAKAMLARLSAQNRFALAFRTHNMKTEAGRKKRIETFVAMLKRGETIYPQRKK